MEQTSGTAPMKKRWTTQCMSGDQFRHDGHSMQHAGARTQLEGARVRAGERLAQRGRRDDLARCAGGLPASRHSSIVACKRAEQIRQCGRNGACLSSGTTMTRLVQAHLVQAHLPVQAPTPTSSGTPTTAGPHHARCLWVKCLTEQQEKQGKA